MSYPLLDGVPVIVVVVAFVVVVIGCLSSESGMQLKPLSTLLI
jgi:hypothetical protein